MAVSVLPAFQDGLSAHPPAVCLVVADRAMTFIRAQFQGCDGAIWQVDGLTPDEFGSWLARFYVREAGRWPNGASQVRCGYVETYEA